MRIEDGAVLLPDSLLRCITNFKRHYPDGEWMEIMYNREADKDGGYTGAWFVRITDALIDFDAKETPVHGVPFLELWKTTAFPTLRDAWETVQQWEERTGRTFITTEVPFDQFGYV